MSERVIKGYHAHIYYDPAKTRDAAARVLEQWGDQGGGAPMPPPRPKRLRQAPPESDEGESQPPLV